MTKKKKNELLESAWRIAFDSATFNVIGDNTTSEDFLNQAREHIRQIDREDWFPEAYKVLNEQGFSDDHKLAERASTNFINQIMGTKNLKVTLGGDL